MINTALNAGQDEADAVNLRNRYLYGGLFDIVAVGLANLLPIGTYDLRHIICAR